jgi:hypothetical protein
MTTAATKERSSSYTELLTGLEIARDLHKLRAFEIH